MNLNIIHGKCEEKLKELPDNSIDSIVTDPPYELGFMGKSWDSTGIAYSVDMWRECLRVLKPGGHMLAFSGTRTYHRMVCAIEDAGFQVRDQLQWIYGSGFPKSLDVSKAIDKNAGEKRPVVGSEADRRGDGTVYGVGHSGVITSNEAITAAAAAWSGWGTALKPAHEPIVLAMKPIKGTVANNVVTHGTGALNIDTCRVGTELIITQQKDKGSSFTSLGKGEGYNGCKESAHIGRWPANVLHDSSEEVIACFPDPKGQMGRALTDGSRKTNNIFGIMNQGTTHPEPRGDEGSAARFFYCAKASKADREEGLEQFDKAPGGMNSNTSGQHSTRRDEGYEVSARANRHPTVKPTSLMRYLVRLITPPGGMVLDPFMGSGSTGKACAYEGFNFTGIEMTDEYLPIAKARIEWALDQQVKEQKEIDRQQKLF